MIRPLVANQKALDNPALDCRKLRKTFGRSIPPVVNPGLKIGRNLQCPCGSGRKFKNCHREGYVQ